MTYTEGHILPAIYTLLRADGVGLSKELHFVSLNVNGYNYENRYTNTPLYCKLLKTKAVV